MIFRLPRTRAFPTNHRMSATATRAEHWFRALVAAVPAFGGISYQSLGDHGAVAGRPVTA